MVLGNKGAYVALAVLVTTVGLLVLLLVNPAPAQENQDDPEWKAGTERLQKSAVRVQQDETSTDPLVGKSLRPVATDDNSGEVTRAVITGISCDEIESGASLIVEDQSDRRGTITNGDGARIRDTGDQIVIRGEGSAPISVPSASGEQLQGELTILSSEGFNCIAADDGGGNVTGDENETVTGDENENEETVITEKTVIKETIPGKDLPNTGGIEGEDGMMASVIAGAGVFVLLGALLVRVYRFRGL